MMAIPSQYEMYSFVLKLMADGKEYSRTSAEEKARVNLHLSSKDSKARTKSGSLIYKSRVSWAITNLERAGMLRRVCKGVYAISEMGKETLARNLSSDEFADYVKEIIDREDPWQRKESKAVISKDGKVNTVASAVNVKVSRKHDQSPHEQLESLASQLNDVLGDELLRAILEKDSDFFERLVVDLLVKMGYGAGVVTPRSGDGGIDGIISTDELGFHPIYTQAKRYDLGNKVAAPTIQAFAGALGSVRNGIFVTTSSFSQQAIEFARTYPHSTISLIDGKRLVTLMIKYDVGVTTESIIRIKRIDSDYFSDEG